MSFKTFCTTRHQSSLRMMKPVHCVAMGQPPSEFKPSKPLQGSNLERGSAEKPHRILDLAEAELNDYCSILPPSGEAEDCWAAYSYLEKERERSEASCSLEMATESKAGRECMQLEHFEGVIRELVSQGRIRDLIDALSTLARLEAKEAAKQQETQHKGTSRALPTAEDPTRRDQLVRLFYTMDTDCNGRIDTAQFREAMRSLGDELSGDVVAVIFEAMDIHGYLDLEQFIAVVEAEEVRSHSSVAEMLRRLHLHPKWWTQETETEGNIL